MGSKAGREFCNKYIYNWHYYMGPKLPRNRTAAIPKSIHASHTSRTRLAAANSRPARHVRLGTSVLVLPLRALHQLRLAPAQTLCQDAPTPSAPLPSVPSYLGSATGTIRTSPRLHAYYHQGAGVCAFPPRVPRSPTLPSFSSSSSLPAAQSPLPRARTRNAAAPRTHASAESARKVRRRRLRPSLPCFPHLPLISSLYARDSASINRKAVRRKAGTRAKQERPSHASLSPLLSSHTSPRPLESVPVQVARRVVSGSTSSRLDRYWSAPRSGRDPGCVHTEAASRRVDSNAQRVPSRTTTATRRVTPTRLIQNARMSASNRPSATPRPVEYSAN
ncbi:hypothetical protein C8R43DRAFT_1134745 [Mycena crocata]|nr:hypothetical protein C8R43DRAFT_1134745 [Mycena crocata]